VISGQLSVRDEHGVKHAKLTLFLVVAVVTLPLNATTCVAGKKFKVRQVCGTVTDKYGAVIPDAKIEIAPIHRPEAAKNVSSDQNGQFAFPDVRDDEYEMRVKYPAFWDAWQPFTVRGSRAYKECRKPIHVVMVPAGGCSYVENAWRKSGLKK